MARRAPPRVMATQITLRTRRNRGSSSLLSENQPFRPKRRDFDLERLEDEEDDAGLKPRGTGRSLELVWNIPGSSGCQSDSPSRQMKLLESMTSSRNSWARTVLSTGPSVSVPSFE